MVTANGGVQSPVAAVLIPPPLARFGSWVAFLRSGPSYGALGHPTESGAWCRWAACRCSVRRHQPRNLRASGACLITSRMRPCVVCGFMSVPAGWARRFAAASAV